MSMYHCNISNVSRAKGSSAVASLAYITGDTVQDERTGNKYDYARKERVLYVNTILPPQAPKEYNDPQILFNSIEKYKKTDNARTAKKIVLALPKELNLNEQKQIIENYIKHNLTNKGYCATYAIHDDDKGQNPHAHILVANRPLDKYGKWASVTKSEYVKDERGQKIPQLDPQKLKEYEKRHNAPFDLKRLEKELDAKNLTGEERAKARQIALDEVQSVRVRKGKGTEKKWQRQNIEENPLDKKEFLQELRKQWAVEANKLLLPEQHIDHRSNAEREIKDIPTIHEGYAARQIEARGGVSERCEINRNIRQANAERRQLEEELVKLHADLKLLESEENKEKIKSTHQIEGEKEYKHIDEKVKPAIIAPRQDYKNQKYNQELVEILCSNTPNDSYNSKDYIKNNIETIKMIANKDFVGATQKFFVTADDTKEKGMDFMRCVVACHGTNFETIQKAVDVVTKHNNLMPHESAKLLNDTLASKEYQQAFEAGQGIWSNVVAKREEQPLIENIEDKEKYNEDIIAILSHCGKYCMQNTPIYEMASDEMGYPILDKEGHSLMIQDIMYKSENIPELLPVYKDIANKDIVGACDKLRDSKFGDLNNEQKSDIIMRSVVNMHGTKDKKMLDTASRIVSRSMGTNYPPARTTSSAEYQQTTKRGGEGILSKLVSTLSGKDDKWASLTLPKAKQEIDDWQWLSEAERAEIRANLDNIDQRPI